MNAVTSSSLAQHLHQAKAAEDAGDLARAHSLLTAAAADHPDSPHVHNSFGMLVLRQGDGAEAARWFARAVELAPHEAALRVNLATAHRTAGDAAAEQQALESVLRIDQRHFVARLRLAELFERSGRGALAVQHWSAVVQLAQGIDRPPPVVADALARGLRYLEQHNLAFAETLTKRFGGALPDGAPHRRVRAAIDHALGRRKVYRNECAGLYVPFLPADEFFDRAMLPWLDEVEQHTAAIRAEALRLVADGDPSIRPYVEQDEGTPENKWSALDRSRDWSACFLWDQGVRNDAVADRCPATMQALACAPPHIVPGKAPTAFFSILKPGAHIPPHTGVTNARAIIHLPLVVPEGCSFRVGGETRFWREGEAFAFDDTIEHEAINPTDKERIVLIFDVWNPHLSEDEAEGLATFFDVAHLNMVSAER